jgi:peroxiredoxin
MLQPATGDQLRRTTLMSKEVFMTVKVGDLAPDFVLSSQTGEKIRLSDYRGKKNVVLAFIPLAWTPV